MCLHGCGTIALFDSLFQELSGLGNRSKIKSFELDVRYQNMAEVARNYAVVALGISCFSCNSVSSICKQDEKGKEEFVSYMHICECKQVNYVWSLNSLLERRVQ